MKKSKSKKLNSSTKTIGIALPYVPGMLYSEYYMHILVGVTDYIIEENYYFKLLLLKSDKWWDNYNFRLKEGIDGLIMTHWNKIFSSKAALEKIKIPNVVINDFDPQIKTSFVYADQVLGGRLVAEHLYSYGHRRMGVLVGPVWSLDSRQRLEGFTSFLKEKEIYIDYNQIEDGKFLEQEGYVSVGKLLKRNKDMTAIFCCNDQMAIGALRKLKELGIKCPKDISLVGYDNESKSELVSPHLTTVSMDVTALAKQAAIILLKHLNEYPGSKKSLWRMHPVSPTLLKRGSVKKII